MMMMFAALKVNQLLCSKGGVVFRLPRPLVSIQRTGSVNPYFPTATIQRLRYRRLKQHKGANLVVLDGIFVDSQIVVKHGIEISVRIFRLVTETITTLYM